MNNKIPWQTIPEDYDFENDFEAPSKIFWCKGPHGNGHWSNNDLWANDLTDTCLEWFRSPKLKITHYAWVDGPKEEISKSEHERLCKIMDNPRNWKTVPHPSGELIIKVGEPKE